MKLSTVISSDKMKEVLYRLNNPPRGTKTLKKLLRRLADLAEQKKRLSVEQIS